MHELSIAMSIVEMAQEEAAQRGCQIEAVHLKLGALSGVVKDALLSSYEIASSDTPLMSSIQLFCCDECGAPTSEIVRGKELEVVALEMAS